MKDHLILSTVHELAYREVAPFLRSLRATGSQARVHFFTCRVDADSLRRMKSWGVSVHPFRYLTFRRRQPLLLLWPLWKRMLAARGFEGQRRLARRVFHLMALRFILYYDFLENRTDRFARVLLTDCRDVYFQRDPFLENTDPGLHCFLEAGTQIIGRCPANRRMILNAFGPEILAELATAPVSCAGTTLGDVESIMIYLREMIATLCRGRRMHAANDQGVHNYLVHRQIVPSLQLHDNYSGSVFTAGCENSSDIMVNDGHEIVRADGSVYPILHQYDRHREISRRLLAKLDVRADATTAG